VSAENLHTAHQAPGWPPRATRLILCVVIVAAFGCIFYQYRIARRALPSHVPYIKWTKSFADGQGFATSPLLGNDGELYLGSISGTMFSLDSSGAMRWQYRVPEFIAGGLLQDRNENIYFTTLTAVYSLTSSGLKRWETACSPGRMWQDDQGSTFDGNVLYAECGDKFCALNKDDGRQIWSRAALDRESAPVMLKDGVLASLTGRQIVAVDREGKTLWTYPRDSIFTYDPRVASNSPPETWEVWADTPIAVGSDGTLYVGSLVNQKFLAVDAHGALKWTFDVGNQGFRTSPVIASDGTVFAVSYPQGFLYAFSPDGSLKWKFQSPNPVLNQELPAPVLGSDGTIYVVGAQRLIALSPEGRMLWELPLQGSFGGSPALAPDGTLYIATQEGAIYAVQTASRGLMQSAWPKYQHDSSNSGRVPGDN
jgi:outer membrane protein assembly factor BamB